MPQEEASQRIEKARQEVSAAKNESKKRIAQLAQQVQSADERAARVEQQMVSILAEASDEGVTRRGVIKGTSILGPIRQGRESSDDRLYLSMWAVHPWSRAAVKKIARGCMRAQATIKAVEDFKNPDPQNKIALRNILLKPNPRQSLSSLLFVTVIRLVVTGEAHWEVVYTLDGEVAALFMLEGDVVPQADKHGMLLDPAYIQKVSGQEMAEFSESEVIEFVLPNPEGGLHGSSDFEALRIAIPSDLSKAKWDRDFFQHNTKPPGLWQLPSGGDPELADRNKEEIRAAAIAANEGHNSPVVIEGDVTYHELSTTPKETEFPAGRRMNRDEICAVLETPLGKLGITEQVNRSNMSEQNRNFQDDAIRPTLELIGSTITRFAENHWDIPDWMVELTSGVYLTADERATLIDKGGSYMKLNEVRTQLLNLPPVPYGDVILIKTPEGIKPLPEIIQGGSKELSDEKQEAPSKELLDGRKIEPEESMVRAIKHGHGCEHDTGRLGNVSFDHPLMKPAEPIAESWHSSIGRMIRKVRANFLKKLDGAMKKGEDYRRLYQMVPNDALTRINIEFFRKAYLAGQKQVAFLGPEDPRSVGGLIEPSKTTEALTELEAIEELACSVERLAEEGKPLIEFDFSIVPDEQWEILKQKSIELSESTMAQLKDGGLAVGKIEDLRNLRTVLAAGWDEGLTYDELAARVQTVFSDFETWKARRIARSETNPTYNMARINSSKGAGYELGRVSLGPRPCEICQAEAMKGPQPLDYLYEWIQHTHPNEQCVIVAVPGPETERIVPEVE